MDLPPSVSYFKNGGDTWRLGLRGLPIRKSGMVYTIALTAFTMGIPWWWQLVPSDVLSHKISIVSLTVLLCVGVAMLLLYLRKQAQRSQKIKCCLHGLTHGIRDKQADIYTKLLSESFSNERLTEELKSLLTQICEATREYFKLLTRDETVNVAIRLALSERKGNNEKRSVAYKTYARSSGFSLNREKSTESLSGDEGTPKFFRSKKYSGGVLVYHNLDAAIEDKVYTPTKNHYAFRGDIETMIVAPLNAWSENRIRMIGLINVTSKGKNVFEAKHTDSLLFISDLTASIIASTVEHVRLKSDKLKAELGGANAQPT